MTDLVRKSRPQTPDQPSLFLSLTSISGPDTNISGREPTLPFGNQINLPETNSVCRKPTQSAGNQPSFAGNPAGVISEKPECAGCRENADSEIVMVDLAFGDDFFEQDRSWDDFGTTISGI